MKLKCEHFISKGGCVFEISPTIWSGYVHERRIIYDWNYLRNVSCGMLHRLKCFLILVKTPFLSRKLFLKVLHFIKSCSASYRVSFYEYGLGFRV